MIATTRTCNNNFVVPALFLVGALLVVLSLPTLDVAPAPQSADTEIIDRFVLALPGGAVETVITEHARTKHEVGTLPASTIFEHIRRGQCRLFYRAASDEYIALVEVNGQCGAARLTRPDARGMRRWAQAFGGSECTAHPAGSCAYWWCCIERGGYVPVAGIGG